MERFLKILKNAAMAFFAFTISLFVSLKSGDAINLKLVASGCRNREFLSFAQFATAFFVPFLMWVALLMATIPVDKRIRKQLRFYGGIGFTIAIVVGELLAVFVFLVRYV